MSTHAPVADTAKKHVAIRSQRSGGFGLAELWRYRELLYFFAWRDLKVRYKQSIIGAGWAILQPLAMMVVFTVFFGRLAELETDGMPGPAFYYAALVPWTFFQVSVSQATNSLVTNSHLVSKVYFPRLLLPISSVISCLVDLAIAFVVLIGFVVYYVLQGDPTVTLGPRLVFIPVFVLLAVLTAWTVGIWLSALNARYRDVRYAVTFILQFWLFASPVAYSTNLIPERWRALYGLNPMAGVIEGFRWSLSNTGKAPGAVFAASAAVVAVGLVFSAWYFRRFEGTFADVI
jgi:lipopolysaccharide transport system permease protein